MNINQFIEQVCLNIQVTCTCIQSLITLKPNKVLLVNWKWHHTSLGLEMI